MAHNKTHANVYCQDKIADKIAIREMGPDALEVWSREFFQVMSVSGFVSGASGCWFIAGGK